MRVAPLVRLAVPFVIVACATTAHEDPPPTPATDVDKTIPAPPAAPAPAETPPPAPADAAPPPPDCSLGAVTGFPQVASTFEIGAPPTMTGGTLDGDYAVVKATVYLPTGAAGLVDTKTSTGKVSAWAVFKGSRYRLHLDSDFTIATTFGPQSQSVNTESQGGFTIAGPALKLDHACDTAITDEADYSFTDDGSGRATLLIKTPTPYGDTYLALEAQK
jgi:hypothetical protein